jgi:hypothetical protein
VSKRRARLSAAGVLSAMVLALLMAFGPVAAAPGVIYSNGFETDTADWYVNASGTANREASAFSNAGAYADGINSRSGSWHARLRNNQMGGCLPPFSTATTCVGPFTRWGKGPVSSNNTVWPGGYMTDVSVYLDVAWAAANLDRRFDWSSAINNNTTGTHLSDFAFNVGTTATGFIIGSSTNAFRSNTFPSNPCPSPATAPNACRTPVSVTTSGWYTFRHVFRDNGGNLAVDMSIINGTNAVVASWTIHSVAMTGVGGDRYGWFANQEIFDLPIDDARLVYTSACTTDCYVDAVNGDDAFGGDSPATAKKTIQAGVSAVNAGGNVHVAAGTYNEDVSLNKAGVKLMGAGVDQSVLIGPIGGAGATIQISAANVLIDGFTITRAGNNTTDWNNPGLNFAGIAVQGQTVNGEVRNNRIYGNRTGIDVNNSNGNNIHNNVIDDNRTGLIFRNQTDSTTFTQNFVRDNWTVGILFLDASGGTNVPVQSALNSTFSGNNISGNWYGQIVDRQSGGTLPAPGTTNLKNFSANWLGTTSPAVTTANSAEPGYAAQIPVGYGGAATNPGGEPDIAGSASANIDFTPMLESSTDTSATAGFQGDFSSLTVTAQGAQTGAVNRIQEGVNSVTASTVHVLAGSYSGTVNIATAGLHLLGPNAGISPNHPTTPLAANPARGPEATIAVTGSMRAINIRATDVRVDGFRFEDSSVAAADVQSPIIGAGPNFGGAAHGAIVSNNVFDAIERIAVYVNGPDSTPTEDVTIADNRVSNPTRPGSGCNTAPTSAPSNCARQLFNPWETEGLVFQRNVAFALQGNNDRVRFLNFSGSSDALIADNTVRYTCHFTCITVAGDSTGVEITGNNLVSHWGNAVQLHSAWSSGAVDVHHNQFTIENNDFAFVVDNIAASLGDVHVNRNSFSSRAVRNGTDVLIAGTQTLDAECNWYGQASGPNTAPVTGPPPAGGQLFGPVDFTPWLLSNDLDGDCISPPTVNTAALDTSGDEGDTLSASGSFDGVGLTLTADNSDGTFVDNGDGSWSWTFNSTDNVGLTTVTVTAEDAYGATATDDFTYELDNVAPTGTFNSPGSVNAGVGFGLSISGVTDPSSADTSAGFTYAFDCGSGVYGVFSSASSASCPGLPSGTYTVKGSVRDKDLGIREYTATLIVDAPAAIKQAVIAELQSMLPTGDKNTDKRIQRAIDRITKSLTADWWISDDELAAKGNKVFDEEKKAVQALTKKELVNNPVAQSLVQAILDADRALAQKAIDTAIALPGKAKDIAKAQDELAKGDAERTAGKYPQAVDRYKAAWENAQKAMK